MDDSAQRPTRTLREVTDEAKAWYDSLNVSPEEPVGELEIAHDDDCLCMTDMTSDLCSCVPVFRYRDGFSVKRFEHIMEHGRMGDVFIGGVLKPKSEQ